MKFYEKKLRRNKKNFRILRSFEDFWLSRRSGHPGWKYITISWQSNSNSWGYFQPIKSSNKYFRVSVQCSLYKFIKTSTNVFNEARFQEILPL